MKKCPFCAEEIQNEAIKCKHCGEFLNRIFRPSTTDADLQWYFRTSVIVVAVLCVGPLALPLIWWHPKMTRAWKVGLTVGILVLTWLLFQATLASFQLLERYYEQLGGYGGT